MSFTRWVVKPWRRDMRNYTEKMNILEALVEVSTDEYTHRALLVVTEKTPADHPGR